MTAKNLEQGVATFKREHLEAFEALVSASRALAETRNPMTEAYLAFMAIEFSARLKGAAS